MQLIYLQMTRITEEKTKLDSLKEAMNQQAMNQQERSNESTGKVFFEGAYKAVFTKRRF